MIVSASYRTDIPAFYGRWFMNRYREGWAKAVNPYGGRVSTIPLRVGVDGFVFWTRNVASFLDGLAEIRRGGTPFVVQYTVTGYPRVLEPSVVEAERSLAMIRHLAKIFGPRAVVWRYDPILATSLTPASWHRDTFARLAERLEGAVDEVSVSFANIYRKTGRNLAAAARAHGFTWSDPDPEERRSLIHGLSELAAQHGITLTVCAQTDSLAGAALPSRCVDARRLEDVAAAWGLPRPVVAKEKGNRPGCLCHESRDIGDYDTCPHGCVYCYAVSTRGRAKRRYAAHDPDSEFLFAPTGPAEEAGPQTQMFMKS
ncbi:DNA repair photolyase [Paramagnetospirillum kuznetsovii]|uniref:DNA repair photolyase n=1 Tax=Paramagnetospirillum kuznetsovii TaxID=2053833 RepID=A0A364P3P2_9PROT|nr:DUF1848 domain-containing protein [Paramagnetospirillum kuznetsovii]RAU23777.1 DNA repair photolyase [Paramagnetospirillum kuznetsovii]